MLYNTAHKIFSSTQLKLQLIALSIALLSSFSAVAFQIRWCNTLDDIQNNLYAECYSNLDCSVSYFPLNRETDQINTATKVILTGAKGSHDKENNKDLCSQNDALEHRNIDWWTKAKIRIFTTFTNRFNYHNFLDDASNKGPYHVNAEIVLNNTSYSLEFTAQNDDIILLRIDKISGKFAAYLLENNSSFSNPDNTNTFSLNQHFKDMDSNCCFKFKQEALDHRHWNLKLITTSKPIVFKKIVVSNGSANNINFMLKPFHSEPITITLASVNEENRTAEIIYNGESPEYFSWHNAGEEDNQKLIRDSDCNHITITQTGWQAAPLEQVLVAQTIMLINTLNEPLTICATPQEDLKQVLSLKPQEIRSLTYYGTKLNELVWHTEDCQADGVASTEELVGDIFVFTSKPHSAYALSARQDLTQSYDAYYQETTCNGYDYAYGLCDKQETVDTIDIINSFGATIQPSQQTATGAPEEEMNYDVLDLNREQ